MKKKTGTQILFECLKKEGVTDIFGFPGGAVLDIYHEFKNYNIRHILVRHEQAAVHAADGYARATGRVGVCLVTSGPGATNTVTGIATAYMDSVPVIVFSGQVPTKLIGNDAFQEADIVGITRPCTKHNYLVKDVDELAVTIREAFHIASTGRHGPILIDLPKDIIREMSQFHYPEQINLQGYNPTYSGHQRQIKRAFNEILESKKPLIYAGGGVISSNASRELLGFAHKLQIPVTTTLMGLGCFPGTDSLSLGMLGMHGTYRANIAVTNCDLLIAIGARFDDRVTGDISKFAPHAKIIHIDIDPTSISKNVRVDTPIVGDVKDILLKFHLLLEDEKKINWKSRRKSWFSQIDKWKSIHSLEYKQKDVIKPQYVVEKLYQLTEGKAIISTEVGQNQMWAAQYYSFDQPRKFLTSGGLGTMGYGFPAAIGAQVAFPKETVIDIAGDGSIQMNIQELATAVHYKLPVKIAILNNSCLGMVRQWQELFYDKNYASTPLENSPDFVKLAEAYGAMGLRATKPSEVVPVIKKALNSKKPVIMDFVVEQEEGVYPMVPAGAAIDEMILL
ncbi:MAG: biosynthetic-type acetolactate synthase large subunit [Deltaproteobacteria bacterium]|nr:biosynthetic-type acetolactate synthase large subunit [Deltaproteobacteria bacterium]